MFRLPNSFTFFVILFVVDGTRSVLAQKDRTMRSPVDNILLLDKQNDDRFAIDLKADRGNASIVLNNKGSEAREEEWKKQTEGKDFEKGKKPRTFLGPLNLDFKDKFNPKRGIIYDTRDSSGGGYVSGFSCCQSRYGNPSYSDRPDYGYGESYGGGRYPYRPTGRPGDRYGSSGLTSNAGRPGADAYSGGSYSTRYGPPRGSYGVGSDGDRYGESRPSYGGGPTGPSGSGGLYGRPSISGGGTYGGSSFGGGTYGGYGGSSFGGSGYGGSGSGSFGSGGHPGSSYGNGGHNGFGGGFGVGGGNGPGGFGGYGSSNDFGGGGDYGYGQGGVAQGQPDGGNAQTQKALALKALAGVALIGAAAALATNPVLLPLGVAHGRKRRSAADDFWSEHPLMLLQEYISQIPRKDITKEDIVILSRFLASRKCVARLACEVQREYYMDLARYKNVGDRENSIYHNLEHRFMNLVRSNVLNNNYVNEHLKKEIKLALTIGAEDGNCSVFPCSLRKG